ncbi:hypothetical protein ASZ90_016052 [hydrocarbon metagenome]|uniref:Uncharacterized protein n=1 Tax=hydrocarbon metagenome TaxID=938273 RepID=A0A0W8F087_9ZZZZ
MAPVSRFRNIVMSLFMFFTCGPETGFTGSSHDVRPESIFSARPFRGHPQVT